MAENSVSKILWDENRRLNWSDFQSTEFIGPSDFTALSKIGINVKWETKLVSTEPCQFVFASIIARGSFHINESWVKEIGRNQEGLRHEQGHFDISEIFARKFNEVIKTQNLMNKSHKCPEINGIHTETLKKIGAHNMIEPIYNTIQEEHMKMQQMYEVQTDNGRVTLKQLELEGQISVMLKQSEPHKAV